MVGYISKKLTINFENQDDPGELFTNISAFPREQYIYQA